LPSLLLREFAVYVLAIPSADPPGDEMVGTRVAMRRIRQAVQLIASKWKS
jgi:hypothetical protein